jgi:dockerin type I repeat protein/cohesin domain-containing protein
MKRWSGIFVVALGILVNAPWGGRLPGADFIRGDVNGDGLVTVSDLEKLYLYIYEHGPGFDCQNAADVNDDGEIDMQDLWKVIDHVHTGGAWPAEPFPSIGPDPTPNHPRWWDGPLPPLDCQSYGGGGPIVDPAAKLTVVDGVLAGGSEAKASVLLAISNSVPVLGFVADLQVAGEIIMGVEPSANLRQGIAPFHGAHATLLDSGILRVEVYKIYENDLVITPGAETTVGEIRLCLKEGVAAGEYPITILSAEVVDAATTQAIHPALEAGSLTVSAPVAAQITNCWPNPLVPVHAQFTIGEAKGKPGSQIDVPFTMRADLDILGYTFSIDFDEEVLQVDSVEFPWQRPDGKPFFTKIYDADSNNRTPGNAGIDEGFFAGAFIIDSNAVQVLPANIDNMMAILHMTIKPDAAVSSTRLRFIDGARMPHAQPTYNGIIVHFEDRYPTVHPEEANSFVILDGRVTILPDIAVFSRGDSNDDGRLDLSDAVATLAFLYQAGSRPACLDAADFTDDGVIDISDPIASLNFLYLGGPPPAAPYPAAGTDPTEDGLGCFD